MCGGASWTEMEFSKINQINQSINQSIKFKEADFPKERPSAEIWTNIDAFSVLCLSCLELIQFLIQFWSFSGQPKYCIISKNRHTLARLSENRSACNTHCMYEPLCERLCDERKSSFHTVALCTTFSLHSVKIYANPAKVCQFIEILQHITTRAVISRKVSPTVASPVQIQRCLPWLTNPTHSYLTEWKFSRIKSIERHSIWTSHAIPTR